MKKKRSSCVRDQPPVLISRGVHFESRKNPPTPSSHSRRGWPIQPYLDVEARAEMASLMCSGSRGQIEMRRARFSSGVHAGVHADDSDRRKSVHPRGFEPLTFGSVVSRTNWRPTSPDRYSISFQRPAILQWRISRMRLPTMSRNLPQKDGTSPVQRKSPPGQNQEVVEPHPRHAGKRRQNRAEKQDRLWVAEGGQEAETDVPPDCAVRPGFDGHRMFRADERPVASPDEIRACERISCAFGPARSARC